MSPKEESKPYGEYASEEEWWKHELERIHKGMAEAYFIASDLKDGGKERIQQELWNKMIERGDESVMDYLDLLIGSQRITLKNAHALSKEQEDDLRKNIIAEFGEPKF